MTQPSNAPGTVIGSMPVIGIWVIFRDVKCSRFSARGARPLALSAFELLRLRRVDHHERVAADAGHVGLGDVEHGGHRDRGVDGVAAALQDRRCRPATPAAGSSPPSHGWRGRPIDLLRYPRTIAPGMLAERTDRRARPPQIQERPPPSAGKAPDSSRNSRRLKLLPIQRTILRLEVVHESIDFVLGRGRLWSTRRRAIGAGCDRAGARATSPTRLRHAPST